MSATTMSSHPLVWVEIDRVALSHNIRIFRGLIGSEKKLLAVVKANAYGHGLLEVSRLALDRGVDWLGVHSLDEALALRAAGLKAPVLILGAVALDGLKSAVEAEARLTVYNPATVDRLEAVCRRLKKKALVHMKVETGTNRQGVSEKQLLGLARKIRNSSNLVLEGLSSHFANIEDTTDPSYPDYQLANYKRALSSLEKRGISIPVKHMSCTAATILFPRTHFDMARVGIGLYGLWPSKETYVSCLHLHLKPLKLKPVLSWKTRVAQVKSVAKGSFVGYGCTYRTTRPSRLAVLPVGYSDGYGRSLSNAGHVLIRGRRAPVRGRVAMDFIIVDVSDIPGVRLEDEATLLGRDGRETISAEQLASLAGTISYEILARINPLIPRRVT
ncbi:MAG: alanine racemase [Candidatus Aminicenantes bacterium]|nr:alanine racemase [Candidatus Aminicenantes bacterium]